MENESGKWYPTALTVAGSDSGGGAGIQADLRTFSAFGVYGCSAITALTAQNPSEVRGALPTTPEFVVAQIEAVATAFNVKAVKTGMLVDAAVIEAVVSALKVIDAPLVVDPVMVSTSGHSLLDPQAVDVMKEKLLPMADWITPNIPEAEMLIGSPIKSENDMLEAAARCSDEWSCGCLLKGGHLELFNNDFCADAVVNGDVSWWLRSPVVHDTEAGHGSGCTFSAALAAGLALDFSAKEALVSAKGFVYGSLMEAVFPGENIEAMYPPGKNYIDQAQLKKTRRR